MKRKIQLGIALVSTSLLLTVAGCGEAGEELPPTEEGRTALENASVLSMKGDLDDIVADSDIWADGQAAGHIQERGFWNSKYTISTGDGEAWFYLRYVTDEPINDVEGVISGNTYGYYDMNDNCLGYAQEQILETDTMERDWYTVFMDADGNPKDYLADEDMMRIFDYDGNVIATGSFSFGDFFHYDKYTIELKEEEGSEGKMDFGDKMCAFLRIDYKVNSDYGD